MADKIEEKALALASKWERRFVTPSASARRQALVEIFTMLVAEQEAHKADKQAFSDAVEGVHAALGLDDRNHRQEKAEAWGKLNSFIIKKPDPLVEAAWIIQNWREGNAGEDTALDTAKLVAEKLAVRGLKIVEANNAPL